MALGVLSRPIDLAAGGTARWMTRHLRLAVPLVIFLICGSFAAAALLNMRLDRSHDLEAAARYEQRRAVSLAAVTGEALDRFAEAGLAYAENPLLGARPKGLINIIVTDADGARMQLRPGPVPPQKVPPQARTRNVVTFGDQAALTIPQDGRVITVMFDPRTVAPESLSGHALLMPASGPALLGRSQNAGLDWLTAPVPGWPLTAGVAVSSDDVLSNWLASVPLNLFVALGPALAGGWLAVLFVGAFERHTKSARALRALRSVRPVEGKLLVRLANAERGAVEALRAKSEFLAHMSHELRTPLNAVIGFSEVIAGGLYGPPGHPKYAEYAGDITRAGRDLHGRIDDILEFANIEAGRYRFALEKVELAQIAASVMAEQEGRAFSRSISLTTGFCEPGAVRADAKAVKRILSNLLDNALAYTPEGGRVRLEVHFEAEAGVVRLTDSGQGFSEGERARAGDAFRRFQRKDAMTGTGLGLAIAMELARAMGGAVTLDGLPAGNDQAGTITEIRLSRV
jgi:signal transduction histidine kinase